MKHALVVDDSSFIRKIAKQILEGMNFEVSEAKDGAQALEKRPRGRKARRAGSAGSVGQDAHVRPGERDPAMDAKLVPGMGHAEEGWTDGDRQHAAEACRSRSAGSTR